MTIRRVATVCLVFTGISVPRFLAAQAPPPSAEALAAGARVTRALIDPYPVRFSRGDSATVKVTLMDSIGGEVAGASWSLRTEGTPDHPIRLVQYRPMEGTGQPTAYVLTGDRPGSQMFYVSVNASVAGKVVARDIDSVTVTVTDWPISRIVIEDLPYAPYVGTTFRLKAKAYTDRGTEASARIIWRTDDPCHALVMPDGVITFAATGKISVIARVEGLSAKKDISITTNPVATVGISPKSVQARVGDLVVLRISAEDRRGVSVNNVAFSFSVAAVDSAGGEIVGDGDFIAENPGTYVVRASAGDPTAEAVIEVGPRPPAAPVSIVSRASSPRAGARALWVFAGKDSRDYAYTGGTDRSGASRVYVWDVTEAAHPVLSDSVSINGAVVTDIQGNGDASWVVIGREPAPGGRGGITVLDLTTPAHPTVAAELSDGVAEGVRGVWVNLTGSLVYAADATSGGMVIFDLANPRQPRFVAAVDATPGRRAEIQDVWADAKNAYLTAKEGLIVLDLADKGTPTAPRVAATLAWNNAAGRSVTRAGRYVFVAETIQECDACVNGPRGRVRVIDVRKPSEPKEVAHFGVPEAGAGRLWVENSVLFAAYNQGGLRIVDVAGELAHDLYRQGRQAGWFGGDPADPRAWIVAAQPFRGRVFAVDPNAGLWILSHPRASRLGS